MIVDRDLSDLVGGKSVQHAPCRSFSCRYSQTNIRLPSQLELAKKVKQGCEEEGLIGLTFNTIGVSDGMTMGTQGMRYSLVICLSKHVREVLIIQSGYLAVTSSRTPSNRYTNFIL